MRLGWGEQSVWLREPERALILDDHPGLFPSLERAVEFILQHPDSVHVNVRGVGDYYFIVAAEALRQAGLIRSRRARLIDAVVEFRTVNTGSFLRVFHIAPTLRNHGGRQLWP